MSSFIASIFAFISNKPESAATLLATSSTFMNSSICPVTLSNDEVWDNLCSPKYSPSEQSEEHFLDLFCTFSDTMQFTEKLRFHPHCSPIMRAIPRTSPFITNGILKFLIQKKRYFTRTLKHLTLSKLDTIPIVCGKLQNITSIDLRWCNGKMFQDKHLQLICENLTLLRKLDLGGKVNVTDDGAIFLSNLKSLVELDLSSTNITSLHFLKTLPNLKGLSVEACRNLSVGATFENEDGDDNTSSNIITAVPVPLSLNELNMRNSPGIAETTIEKLNKYAPDLLNFSCSNLRLEAFESLPKLKNLHQLELRDCKHLSEGAVKILMKSFELLRVLHIDSASVSDESLKHIGQTSAPIRELKFKHCKGFTNEGFAALTALKELQSLEVFENADRLFTGDIGEENFFSASLEELLFGDCHRLNGEGITSILKSLSLKKLQINGCAKIVSQDLSRALDTSNSKNSLVDLSLSNSWAITHVNFLVGVTALKRVVLSDSALSFKTNVVQQTSFDPLSSSSSLEVLELNGVPSLETDDIIDLSSQESAQKTLKILSLNFCLLLTDRALTEGVCKMKALTELQLFSRTNSNFTIEAVIKVVDSLPLLKKILLSNDMMMKIENDPVLKKKIGPLAERHRGYALNSGK